MINDEKLKKCPFCGAEVTVFSGIIAGVTMIVCTECRATVSFGGKETRKETIKAWNRRKNNENPR